MFCCRRRRSVDLQKLYSTEPASMSTSKEEKAHAAPADVAADAPTDAPADVPSARVEPIHPDQYGCALSLALTGERRLKGLVGEGGIAVLFRVWEETGLQADAEDTKSSLVLKTSSLPCRPNELALLSLDAKAFNGQDPHISLEASVYALLERLPPPAAFAHEHPQRPRARVFFDETYRMGIALRPGMDTANLWACRLADQCMESRACRGNQVRRFLDVMNTCTNEVVHELMGLHSLGLFHGDLSSNNILVYRTPLFSETPATKASHCETWQALPDTSADLHFALIDYGAVAEPTASFLVEERTKAEFRAPCTLVETSASSERGRVCAHTDVWALAWSLLHILLACRPTSSRPLLRPTDLESAAQRQERYAVLTQPARTRQYLLERSTWDRHIGCMLLSSSLGLWLQKGIFTEGITLADWNGTPIPRASIATVRVPATKETLDSLDRWLDSNPLLMTNRWLETCVLINALRLFGTIIEIARQDARREPVLPGSLAHSDIPLTPDLAAGELIRGLGGTSLGSPLPAEEYESTLLMCTCLWMSEKMLSTYHNRQPHEWLRDLGLEKKCSNLYIYDLETRILLRTKGRVWLPPFSLRRVHGREPVACIPQRYSENRVFLSELLQETECEPPLVQP